MLSSGEGTHGTGCSHAPCPQNNVTNCDEWKNREKLFKSLESAAQRADDQFGNGKAWIFILVLLACAVGQAMAVFLLGRALPWKEAADPVLVLEVLHALVFLQECINNRKSPNPRCERSVMAYLQG